MPRPRPCTGLVAWLKHEHCTNDGGVFSHCRGAFHFNKDGILDQDDHQAWWQDLPTLHNLTRANKALMPPWWPLDQPDPGAGDFLAGNPKEFFAALLDRLFGVMDEGLCSASGTQCGVTFFETKFRWLRSTGLLGEVDCNVCMPWNKSKVKHAKHMSVTGAGYLTITLGEGLSPTNPCKEYGHRIICFLFNGPPPPHMDQVSHRCHNKECLNPSHLVWATHKTNYHQPKRQHTQE